MGEKKCPYSFPEENRSAQGGGRVWVENTRATSVLRSHKESWKGAESWSLSASTESSMKKQGVWLRGIWREGWGIWPLPWNLGGWGGEKWQAQHLWDASHGSKAFGASLESDFIIWVCGGHGRRLSGAQLISLVGHKGVETACWAHLLPWRDNTESESLTAAACTARVLVSSGACNWMGGGAPSLHLWVEMPTEAYPLRG